MNKRQVDIELSVKLEIMVNLNFMGKLTQKYFPKSIKNHLASNGYYPDTDSLEERCGLKDIFDIHQDMIITLLDLLEIKR